MPAMQRCAWTGTTDELLIRHHDEEWGVPTRDERTVFEFLILEGAQAGLSWTTILRKRENFRTAFARFDPARVAAYDDGDVARLLADAGIVRNRAKIEAAIANARAAPSALDDVPAVSHESTEMAKELRRRGFRFIGPTTAYALMQATGMVDDHLAGCHARRDTAGSATG
jgi:DNA-3-methyladenine glycosylase I